MNRRCTLAFWSIAVLGAPLQASSATAAEEREEAKAGTAYLRRTEIRSTKVVDARHVLVMMRDRTSVTVPGSNEHISVPGPALVPGAVCQLGVFTPIGADEVDALVAATDVDKPSRRRSDRDAVKTEAVPAQAR